MTRPLLAVEGLEVAFQTDQGELRALRGIDLQLSARECLGLIGESGSGKSLTALAVMGLLPPGAVRTAGRVVFDGVELTTAPEPALEALRGRRIAMIFQEPMTALNPVMRVGEQIAAPVRKHLGLSRKAARERAIEQLAFVGIPDPRQRVDAFPHQLSGGMRQRVMIAMALACEPRLLIADEPTTALDVTIQAQILELLRKLQEELDLAVIIITHDFGVIAEVAHRVCVMYGGRVVEEAGVDDLFDRPLHPYSRGLLASTPTLEMPLTRRMPAIGGAVPHMADTPSGCAFHPRCGERLEPCDKLMPELQAFGEGQRAACWARSRPS